MLVPFVAFFVCCGTGVSIKRPSCVKSILTLSFDVDLLGSGNSNESSCEIRSLPRLLITRRRFHHFKWVVIALISSIPGHFAKVLENVASASNASA